MRPENQEFIALFEASGWNQTQAAKRLYLEAPTISRYLNPDPKKSIAPAKGTIEHFKMILASEKPGALSAIRPETLANWERKVLDDLRALHECDRKAVLAVVHTMVHRMPKREAVDYDAINFAQQHSAHSEPTKVRVPQEIEDHDSAARAAAGQKAPAPTTRGQPPGGLGPTTGRKR